MVFLPESPRWLLSRERYEEGESVLASLRGLETHHPEVQQQKAIILDSIRAAGQGASFKSLFSNGKSQHMRRMLVGSSAQLFQQIGGCNAVIYYLPVLLEENLGQTRTISLVVAAANATCYALASTSSWFLIERVGRRKLFLWGTIGQCLAMVITFACLIPSGVDSNNTSHEATQAAKGGVFGLFVFIMVFGATWLPLPWLYPAEVNPIKTRGKANAVSTCTNWVSFSHFKVRTMLIIQALQLCYRDDHTNHDLQHRLDHLPHLRHHQCLLPANRLLLLPRDSRSLTRGDRSHLRQGLPRRYVLRQSVQGNATP